MRFEQKPGGGILDWVRLRQEGAMCPYAQEPRGTLTVLDLRTKKGLSPISLPSHKEERGDRELRARAPRL